MYSANKSLDEKRADSLLHRNIYRKVTMCNIAKKEKARIVCFWEGWGWESTLYLKIKSLPFSHEDVLDLYSEKPHSCKEKKNRIHLKKNILVLENKDLHLSSGFYLL